MFDYIFTHARKIRAQNRVLFCMQSCT